MKRDTLEEKLQELQLKLIEVQTQIAAAPPKAIEDFKVAKGYVPEGYKTVGQLETEKKTLEKQIEFIKGEIANAGSPQKKGKTVGVREHEKVKAEYERLRKIKKIPEGQDVDKILDEVADNLDKSFESTKKAFYYKPKK